MDFNEAIDKLSRRYAEVENSLANPEVFNDQKKSQELTRDYARLKELKTAGEHYQKTVRELADNRELAGSEPADSELGGMAREEIERLESELKGLELIIQEGLLPADPTDSRNTIIEIRAGAGGAESALFAAELYRMYTRYAEARGWRIDNMESSPSDLGGFREIIFQVNGDNVYKRFKFESGVHRVQRVPTTEASGRIHTSTATVAVLPEAEEVDVEIDPDDLEINVCRASGHGGQGVNTTDSAVRIFHKPSKIEVRCQDERSQIKNRAKAMKVLRSRLLERKIAEEKARYDAHRSEQVGTGERNEKIRTYNFPQNRVTDHRIELSLHNLPSVIEGELDCLIEPLLTNDIESRLEAITK